ncbi:MAG: TetR family transcriptional regulator [Pararhodobacter sp.]|nr:TetR family transcriptional regulator [Pararhodobacter sp.]
MSDTTERTSQKQRTRDAILDGARRLLARGEAVTVAAAAAEHRISRATAYRYFSDPQALTLEAGLATLVPPYEEVTAGTTDLRSRLSAITAAMIRLTLENETAFRQYLSHAVTAPGGTRTRGARRVAYMKRALRDMPHDLAPARQADLVASLSTVAGVEGLISLTDVAGRDTATAARLMGEIADAILTRHLGPGAAAKGEPGKASSTGTRTRPRQPT